MARFRCSAIEGMSLDDIDREIAHGGCFVIYQYCISIGIMAFRRSSRVYFLKGGAGRGLKGLPYSLLSLVFGWWAFPHGPIWTIQTIVSNTGGGKDVTPPVRKALAEALAPGTPVSGITPG